MPRRDSTTLQQDREVRFWAHVNKTPTCWLWTGYRVPRGYGQVTYMENGAKIKYRAHRVAYMLHYGPILPGIQVLHRCDTRACVRPDHLFLGTNVDNVQDRVAKGRTVLPPRVNAGTRRLGEHNLMARLTDTIVTDIRRLHGEGWSLSALARQYGIAPSHAGRIVKRRYWAHVP